MINRKNVACRTRPSIPRLQINSEDMDVGPPLVVKPDFKTYLDQSQLDLIQNHPNQTTSNKALSAFCQYESVDLDNLEEA